MADRDISNKEVDKEDEGFENGDEEIGETDLKDELENIIETGFSPDINLDTEITPVLKPREVSLERGLRFFSISEEEDEQQQNVYQLKTEDQGESQKRGYSMMAGYEQSESYEMRMQTPDGSSGRTITASEEFRTSDDFRAGFGEGDRGGSDFKEKSFEERVRSYETEQEKRARDTRRMW